jgi:hypothetical protein
MEREHLTHIPVTVYKIYFPRYDDDDDNDYDVDYDDDDDLERFLGWQMILFLL